MPSWQWHRTGYHWSPVRTLPVAPLWCDRGPGTLFPNSRGDKAAANLHLFFSLDSDTGSTVTDGGDHSGSPVGESEADHANDRFRLGVTALARGGGRPGPGPRAPGPAPAFRRKAVFGEHKLPVLRPLGRSLTSESASARAPAPGGGGWSVGA